MMTLQSGQHTSWKETSMLGFLLFLTLPMSIFVLHGTTACKIDCALDEVESHHGESFGAIWIR